LEHLEAETPRGFSFCVLLPNFLGSGLVQSHSSSGDATRSFINFARRKAISVRWLAIETGGSDSRKE
jgi:hypothetical protein